MTAQWLPTINPALFCNKKLLNRYSLVFGTDFGAITALSELLNWAWWCVFGVKCWLAEIDVLSDKFYGSRGDKVILFIKILLDNIAISKRGRVDKNE